MWRSTYFSKAVTVLVAIVTMCFTNCSQPDAKDGKAAVSAPAAPELAPETDESDGAEPEDGADNYPTPDEAIKNLDCLAVVPVTQFPLQQAAIDTLEATKLGNDFICFQTTGQAGVDFAYRIPGSGDWYTFASPFPEAQGLNIEAAEFVNIDGSGKPEIMLRGKSCGFGSGAGSCNGGLAIYRVEEEPVRIFIAINSCVAEGFSSPNNTDNDFRCVTVQPVQLQNGKLVVGKAIIPEDNRCCTEISQLQPGQYSYHDGRFMRD